MGVELNVEKWNETQAAMTKAYAAMKAAQKIAAEKKEAYDELFAQCKAFLTGGKKKRGRKAAGATA